MLGLKIRAYMDTKGIKQTYLSDKTGLPIQTVNAILNGNRKIEAVEYYAICQALERPLEYFLQEENNLPRQNKCSNN
ncbi:MAG: helix-turn-helix transcriptional regulator [Lachnospiraceae bacterium]|nr:helix-turn-helix transcriptional regulator [Lachnospiraceae bacterium]